MAIQFRWLGHSTWWLESGEHRILIDPFLTGNPAAACSADELVPTHILVSHGHADHITDAAPIALRSGATVIANYEIATWLADKYGVAHSVGMNLGGSVNLPFGRVEMTIAWHSSQLPDGSYGGNPGGFLIELDKKRIYFAGDTALFSDMRLLADQLDVAILPIGDLFTMGPEQSVQAVEWLEPRVVLPMHFNTWPPINQDPQRWAELVAQRSSARPVVLQSGDTFTLD